MVSNGSIKRVIDKSYTVIHNEFLRRTDLSWQAKGLLTYLLTLPDDWKLYLKDLRNRATNGRDSVTGIMNELMKEKYISRKEIRESGMYKGYEYTVTAYPQDIKTADFPATVNPNSVNPTLVSTNSSNYSINKVTKVTKGSSSLPYTKEDIFRYKTILKQTLINVGTFRTNINADTKTMKRVFKYLYEIEHNLFLPGKTIESPLLQEMDVTRIDRVMTPKQLQLILKKAARNWKSYFSDKNIITPEKRPSLDSWFYSPPPNSKQGMSWFLYCATDSLCEQGDVKAKKMLENIKVYLEKFVKDPQKLSEILYNKSEQKKWSEGDHVTFFSTIKQIIAWRAENREKLSEKNEGWGTHFGSIEKTFTTISIFLEDCFPQPNPRFLAVDGWNWNQFVNYIDNSYDINLRS